LPAEADKVGGFGFTLREHMDLLRPAESLKRILSVPDVEPVPYGLPEKFSRFARNQFLLRTWKHRI
jgi:NAD(P)H-dependent FMN reductase